MVWIRRLPVRRVEVLIIEACRVLLITTLANVRAPRFALCLPSRRVGVGHLYNFNDVCINDGQDFCAALSPSQPEPSPPRGTLPELASTTKQTKRAPHTTKHESCAHLTSNTLQCRDRARRIIARVQRPLWRTRAEGGSSAPIINLATPIKFPPAAAASLPSDLRLPTEAAHENQICR